MDEDGYSSTSDSDESDDGAADTCLAGRHVSNIATVSSKIEWKLRWIMQKQYIYSPSI